MQQGRERIKYITAVVLYGTIGLFLRFVHVPSEFVAMCRGAIGSVFILLYLKTRHQKLDAKVIRENRFLLILSGVLLGLNWIFLFAAYTTTTVAIASLCNYMAPMIVIVVAPFVLREKIAARKIPCVLAALLGIILVSGVFGGESGNPKGVFLGLLAALCFVGIVLCNRSMKDVSPMERSVVQLAVSCLTILPYVLAVNRNTLISFDVRSVAIILMLGIVHTGFAYVLYFSGMATLPVQTVAIWGYLEPVVSVLCSFFFLHEPMGLAGWIGAALIIAAAVVSELL
ncbi:MAG: EamA family transporter [Lachnospiraceae bacterium]|nr:EamA family transporter [Lachnospiraceae bacterium]